MEELTHPLPPPAFTKALEMICEAIPGCVMQLYVLLSMLAEGRSVSRQAYLSLLVSALSTGYSVRVRGRREREPVAVGPRGAREQGVDGAVLVERRCARADDVGGAAGDEAGRGIDGERAEVAAAGGADDARGGGAEELHGGREATIISRVCPPPKILLSHIGVILPAQFQFGQLFAVKIIESSEL